MEFPSLGSPNAGEVPGPQADIHPMTYPCPGTFSSDPNVDDWWDNYVNPYAWNEQPAYNGTAVTYANGNLFCLDGDKAFGTYGNVYLDACQGNQGSLSQQWQELSTATGWALINQQTKLVLDGATGPNNNGKFPSGIWAATNIGNIDTWARWH